MSIEIQHGNVVISETSLLSDLGKFYETIQVKSQVHANALKTIIDRVQERRFIPRSMHTQALKIVERYHDDLRVKHESLDITLTEARTNEGKMEQLAMIQRSQTSSGNFKYLEEPTPEKPPEQPPTQPPTQPG